ncbi:MAG: VirK/YbjX family protein [Methylophilus sp.]
MHSEIIKAGKVLYPIAPLINIFRRLKFLSKVKQVQPELDTFIQKITDLGYANIFKHDPHVLGAVLWPYIHNEWNVAQRFSAIAQHYELLKDQPKFLDVSQNNINKIIDLSEFSVEASLILDRPPWFIREGEVTANLFKADLRVMSIAFSLGKLNDELVIYVGGIQGIHAGVGSDESLEIIKGLTKDLQGIRPRSFMIEILRLFSVKVGAKKILAISDAHRHHRHPYFKGYLDKLSTSNYDDIWMEHGGVATEGGFFTLPLEPQRKDIAEVSSNKRSMYKKRYAMLDKIEQEVLALT